MSPGDKVLLYLRTLRHVKPSQIANRVWRRVRPVRVHSDEVPAASALLSHPECRPFFLARPPSILGPSHFHFLNVERELCFPNQWVETGESLLWTYNLHYFDGLSAPETDPAVKRDLVGRWIVDNEIGVGPGWEPYPLSLRVVNWIKWLTTSAEETVPAFTESLVHQVRYLSQVLEYHLMGNHLLANAKALVVAGLAFEGEEAQGWYSRGMKILTNQTEEQFLCDGGHFELSPVYHAIVTEDLLDVIHVHELSRRRSPEFLVSAAERAVQWLATMTRPDGLPPLFNDAAYGVAPMANELISYAERLGVCQACPVRRGLTLLKDSGYIRYEEELYSLFWDVGEIGPTYLPGHAHCDMLSFELSAGGHPLLVDTGTSTYAIGARRHYERGTSAHNTVQIGDLEQSEIWAGFRVARRATLVETVQTGDAAIRATLRGFAPRKIHHTREFTFLENALKIDDEVEGGAHGFTCVARFHFHPGEEPQMDGPAKVFSNRASMNFRGAQDVRIADYQYAPEFNRLIPARVVEVEFARRLETEIRF